MCRRVTVLLCLALMVVSVPINGATTSSHDPGNQNSGPFVDKVVYKVINGADQEVLSLLNNQIDLIGAMVDPSFLSQLLAADDIQVASVPRNGYGYLTINTDKYPYNITNFRRALAFALDKIAISEEVLAGLAQPQDSCVPRVNPFSVEGLMPYNYYEPNVPLGNQLLNDSGFADVDLDGWREAPNGQDFKVTVNCASSSAIAVGCGAMIASTLQSLRVRAYSNSTDFYEYLNRLYFHGDYDMVFLGASFSTFDVDWLGYEFSSINYHTPYYNFPNWRNASYDSWRDQLLHSTSYDEVYQAAIEMQNIWIHACPEIVLYENLLLSAYRTDRFEGFINAENVNTFTGPDYFWTNCKVHLKSSLGGPFSGKLRWSEPMDLDIFSPVVIHPCYCQYFDNMLYSSLLVRGLNGLDTPWLAESYIIETHDDNAAIPAGHTRFTFDIVKNATWTDGIPLTAEDVAYTFNSYKAPSSPFAYYLDEMTGAYAMTGYRAAVEFNGESYWYLHDIAYAPIIPKHFFIAIRPDNWSYYNPRPPEDKMVTSGPFNVSAYVQGDRLEFSRNPDYFYGFSDSVRGTTTSNTTTEGMSFPVGALAVAASTSTIIVFCALIAARGRSKAPVPSTPLVDVGAELGVQIKQEPNH